MAPRLSVRDVLGPALIFIGALLLVAAVAMPLYLVNQVRKIPMDLDSTTVSQTVRNDDQSVGSLPARILNTCSLNERRAEVADASLVRQQRLLVVDPASASTATFQVGSSIKINSVKLGDSVVTPSSEGTGENGGCMGSLVTAIKDKVTVNRESAEPAVGGGGASDLQVDQSEKTVRLDDRQGVQYRFGFDVDKSGSYKVFDATTRQANDATFVGETDVAGVNTYHFTVDAPEYDMSQLTDGEGQPLPNSILNKRASWFGKFKGINPRDELPATLFQKTKTDLYVDPVSGTIVNQRQHVQQYYKFSGVSDGAGDDLTNYRLTNLDATFEYDQGTQQAQASQARDIAGPVQLWGRWVPIVAGIVGLIALIVGIWLLLRGAKNDPTRSRAKAADAKTTRINYGDSHTAGAAGAAGAGAAGVGAAGVGAAGAGVVLSKDDDYGYNDSYDAPEAFDDPLSHQQTQVIATHDPATEQFSSHAFQGDSGYDEYPTGAIEPIDPSQTEDGNKHEAPEYPTRRSEAPASPQDDTDHEYWRPHNRATPRRYDPDDWGTKG